MEEIKQKAHEDELNKAQEEIHTTPHEKVEVPKSEELKR
jgi:hypothetical protein